MDGRINSMHCRYRILGTHAAAPGLAGRLDRLAHQRVIDACAAAFERVLGDDPTVYVLRRVTCSVSLTITADSSDEQLAAGWGRHLARAAIHHLARDADDGEQIVCFANQAAFVAHFIDDLLRGNAWARWYYHPFRRLQAIETPAALRTLLEENRAHTPALLAELHRLHCLDRCLATLGDSATRALWAGAQQHDPALDAAAMRPLFVAALRLAEHLGFGAPSAAAAEAQLPAYCATASAPIDWRDTRSLAAAVFAMLRWLHSQAGLRSGAIALPALPTASHQAAQAKQRQQIAAVCAEFDWLDNSWLADAIADLMSAPLAAHPALPARVPAYTPTARQRRLLADLQAALGKGDLYFDQAQPAAPGNALRLYAALVAHAPEWSEDPLAMGVIELLLDAWSDQLGHAAAAPAPAGMPDGRAAEPGQAAVAMAAGSRSRAYEARLLAAFGTAAAALLDRLALRAAPQPIRAAANRADMPGAASAAGQRTRAEVPTRDHAAVSPVPPDTAVAISGPRPAGQVIDTECAGVLLLIRALLDMQLPALLGRVLGSDAATTGAYLIALGMRWAGAASVAGEQPDPALAVLAGVDQTPNTAELLQLLAAGPPDMHMQIQSALLHTLVGQRVIRAGELHLHDLALDGQLALIAGDETAGPWVFGATMRTLAEAGGLLPAWIAAWQQASGRQPPVIAAVPLRAALFDHKPCAVDSVEPHICLRQLSVAGVRASQWANTCDNDSALPCCRRLKSADCGNPTNYVSIPEGSAAARHYQARAAALAAALAALAPAQLGRADLDLGLALTAITLLRVWARWLRQFAASSTPYLLEQFIRRPGRVLIGPDRIVVELARGPLDIVLEMAGYTAEIERLPWLGRRSVYYRFQ